MFNLGTAFSEATKFGYDVQRVIALRMMRLAGGGARSRAEAKRMFTEKIAALAMAQTAAAVALATGKSPRVAAKRALTPLKRRVRANRRRLSR